MLPKSYPDTLRLEIDDALVKLFPDKDSCPQELYEAMQYSLMLPAKRFRPILLLLSAQTVGFDYQLAIPTACAIEFIHTYSLIHDDLPAIDDDDLRRGQQTCHRKFGEDIAILAGDALFAESFALIAKHQSGKAQTIVNVISEIAQASGIGGMVGGQTADVMAVGRDVDQSTLDYIHRKKTGSLIVASVRCGALLGEASEASLADLTSFAKSLGLAFQIVDDILDLTGTTQELGKPAKSDLAKSKATFPSLYGIEASQQLAAKAVIEAKEALASFGEKSDRLADLADFVLERTK